MATRSTAQPSTFIYDRWEEALARHPDQKFVKRLLHGIKHGVPVGHNGTVPEFRCRNLPTNTKGKQFIAKYLLTEVKEGRMLGPFRTRDLWYGDRRVVCNPVGTVPKDVTGFRMITHFSYPRSGISVNSGIPHHEKTVHFPKLADVVRMIRKLGPGAFIWKTDWSSAYRQILVREQDRWLLGLHLGDWTFVDCRLPFGLASSAQRFSWYARAFLWVLRSRFPHLFQQGQPVVLAHCIDYYNEPNSSVESLLDDFFGGAHSEKDAWAQLRAVGVGCFSGGAY